MGLAICDTPTTPTDILHGAMLEPYDLQLSSAVHFGSLIFSWKGAEETFLRDDQDDAIGELWSGQG